jgi:hypothetical protein
MAQTPALDATATGATLADMVEAHPKALPQPLATALALAAQAISSGDLPPTLLDEIIVQLDEMPPQSVAWADRVVADLAWMFRVPPRQRSLLDWLRPHYSAFDILERQPRSARLFMFHRDGYVREAALDCITEGPSSAFALAAVAFRLNDWVGAVRIAARRCAERTFPITPPDVVVASAPYLLDRRRHWGRWEEPDAVLVDHIMDRPDVAQHLAQRLASTAPGPLATQFRYACRGSSLDPNIASLATDARNPAVRAAATQMLIEGRAVWPTGFGREWIDRRYGLYKRTTEFADRPLTVPTNADAVIRRALVDRSASVRRVAADALIARRATYPHLDEAVEVMLGDRSPGLRERGAFLVRERAGAG